MSATISATELLDEDGLLIDFSLWNEPLAETLARDAGIGPMTDMHWKIIRAMRSHYAKRGVAPVMQRICSEIEIDRQFVNDLFGYCLVAWQIAGLPNPGEEAKSYLSGM